MIRFMRPVANKTVGISLKKNCPDICIMPGSRQRSELKDDLQESAMAATSCIKATLLLINYLVYYQLL